MNLARAASLSLLFASACLGATDDDADVVGVSSAEVYGGALEPAAQHPWDVTYVGALACRGTLIHPRWVVTAAHCVSLQRRVGSVKAGVGGDEVQVRSGRVILHPSWDARLHRYDIALIELDAPFTLDRYVQTAALPKRTPALGRIGDAVGAAHGGDPLPAGMLSVIHPWIAACIVTPSDPRMCLIADGGTSCPSDSGGGFVTREVPDGLHSRAVLSGVVATGDGPSCRFGGPSGEIFSAIDVLALKPWLLGVMGMTENDVRGDVVAQSEGSPAEGVIRIECSEASEVVRVSEASLGVDGVEVGTACAVGSTVEVSCALDGTPLDRVIQDFRRISAGTMRINHDATFGRWTGAHVGAGIETFFCRIGLPPAIIIASI